MTIFFLRHALTSHTGVSLAGRLPGVHLTPDGWTQARAVAHALAAHAPVAIYSSPLERAVETATPLAARLGRSILLDGDLVEIDFGRWSGRTFDELHQEEPWQTFNDQPDQAVIPGGESLAGVAARGCRALVRIAAAHPQGTVVVVSHGDVIRLTLTSLLGIPLAGFRAFTIEPGQACRLAIEQAKNTMQLDALGPLPVEYDMREGPDWSLHAGRRHHSAPIG
jgi:probable phosphoglycerate mutase